MAKTKRRRPAPALNWDIHHHGARQIWCAALTGFAAQRGMTAARAVDLSNQVMDEVIRRTEHDPHQQPIVGKGRNR